MRRIVAFIAVLLVACTNDYGAFRYPKKRPLGSGGAGGAGDAAAGAPSDAGDAAAGAPSDAGAAAR